MIALEQAAKDRETAKMLAQMPPLTELEINSQPTLTDEEMRDLGMPVHRD